jgi:diguanylate cyclase (GGDEF)-like protein
MVLACTSARAEVVDVSQLTKDHLGTLGLYADVLTEDANPLTLDAARALYAQGQFAPGARPALSFGIGARPVWVRLALFNPGDGPTNFYTTLGATWIDQLDVYLVRADGIAVELHAGDALPGALGIRAGIGVGKMLPLPTGHSELYVRAQTSDPLLLPMTLVPEQELAAKDRSVHYAYGALYGFLLALIIYNCVLFFGLYQRSHLYYSLYLLCFIAMNFAYTGHGFAYLWPDRPDIQRFVIVAAIVVYAASGLLFASSFLDLAKHAARLYRWVRGFALGGLLTMALCIALDSQLAAVLLAFCYLTTVTVIMLSLGVYALLTQRGSGGFFFAATLFGMLGAATTTISVWGAIPYNLVTYHGIDIGIVVEATLLALALARQVSYEQIARLKAEHVAQHDPLTELYNRRAFFDLSRAAWAQSQRNTRPMSVLILDLDYFKEVNDRHGHEVGDKLLISVSRLLKATCRMGDLLARWGGEEFVLLMPETDLVQARVFAERIRKIIEDTGHPTAQDTIRCTASIGVADYAGDADLNALIARADARLYEAKAGGRNQVCG